MYLVFKKVAYCWTEKEQWFFCVNERAFMSISLTLGSLERPRSAFQMASIWGHFSVFSALRASKNTSGLYKIPSFVLEKHVVTQISFAEQKDWLWIWLMPLIWLMLGLFQDNVYTNYNNFLASVAYFFWGSSTSLCYNSNWEQISRKEIYSVV